MSGFTTVASGGQINASDINQSVNALAGTPPVAAVATPLGQVTLSHSGGCGERLSTYGRSIVVPNTAGYYDLVDLTNPAAPTLNTTVQLPLQSGTTAQQPSAVYTVGERYALIASGNFGHTFVADLGQSTVPGQWANSSVVVDLIAQGRYAIDAEYGNPGLAISVIDPTLTPNGTTPPRLVVSSSSAAGRLCPAGASGVWVTTANASTGGVHLYLVSIPGLSVGTSFTDSTHLSVPYGICAFGQFLAIANNGANNVVIYSVASGTPVYVSTVAVGSGPTMITAFGGFLAVCNKTGGTVSIIDVRNPASPAVVQTITTNGQPTAVEVVGRLLVVGTTTSLQTFDISGIDALNGRFGGLAVGALTVEEIAIVTRLLRAGGLDVGVGGLTSSGDVGIDGKLTIGGHISGYSRASVAPSLTAFNGNTVQFATPALSGNFSSPSDTRGIVLITTGASPGAGLQCAVTFGQAFPTKPIVLLTSYVASTGNGPGGVGNAYQGIQLCDYNSNYAYFGIGFFSTPAANQTYAVEYMVMA